MTLLPRDVYGVLAGASFPVVSTIYKSSRFYGPLSITVRHSPAEQAKRDAEFLRQVSEISSSEMEQCSYEGGCD